MLDQLSNEDLVWQLTPTEFKIAHLSLTLSKKEISEKLTQFNAVYEENIVGTHLTSVYRKLHLSGYSDDIKRALLKSQFGEIIEKIAGQVKEDYDGEYKKRRKAYQSKKSGTLKQKGKIEGVPSQPPSDVPKQETGVDTTSTQPRMDEAPPSPRPQPQTQPETGRRRLPRTAWFIAGFLVLFGGCSLFAFNLIRGFLDQPATNTPRANTQVVVEITEPSSAITQSPTQTTEPSVTATFTSLPATETPAPQTLPTAVPLPIIEHFNEPMSKVWQITGEPILTASHNRYDYVGILTGLSGEPVSIAAGNAAWTDYIIHIRMNNSAGYFLLGFRVQDLNNMLGIECEAWNCDWIVIKNGKKEVLSVATGVFFETEFTLTLDGENINGLTNYGEGFEPKYPFMVLPPKYQGQFLNGGVYIRFVKDQGYDLEIDYVEILSVH